MNVGTLVMLNNSHAGIAARTVGKVIDREKVGRRIVSYSVRILGLSTTDILVIAAGGITKI
jgi:hypothetical protein